MTEITLKRQNTSQLQFLCKQQEAVEWIEALLGAKVADPDLSISLRDGTMLYSIMTKIKEGSMARKPLKTTVPFKMSENAIQFTNAAKAYGCTEVFLPGDLVNKTNMMNVLSCLHNLAELAHKRGEAPKWPGADDPPPTVPAPEKKIKKFGSVKVSHLKEESEVRSKRSVSDMKRVDPDKLRALLGEDDDVDIRLMSQSILKDEPSNQNANAGQAEQKPDQHKQAETKSVATEEKPAEQKAEHKHEEKATEHKSVEHKPVEEKKIEAKPIETKPEEKPQQQEHKPTSPPPAEEKSVEQKPAEKTSEAVPVTPSSPKQKQPKHDRKLSITETAVKEGKPVETKPVETKPAEQTQQQEQQPEPAEKTEPAPSPIVPLQATPPGSPADMSDEEKTRLRAEKAERLRLRVIQEIISTERDYVRDLERAVEVFVNPLRGFDFMEAGSVNAIFSNIEMIIQVNKQLLKKLDDRLEDSSPKYWIVGDIFLDMADYLKMYTVYCSNQEQSVTTLERYLKESEDFQSWIKDAHKNPALNGLTLRDYLVKPVQRICRYPLLLRELLKNTHDLHVDYDKLVGALARMETLASYVNEAKRHEENLNKVLEIQRVVQGCDNLITPTRRFIREGDLTVIEKGKPKIYRGWLFTDMLMYAKTQRNISFSTKKGFYVYKDRIGFNDCIITDWPDSKDIKNAFVLQSISRAAKFVIGCSTKEEKDIWVEDITKATEALMQLDAAKKRLSLPTRSRGNSGADTTTAKRSSLNTVQAELMKEYVASENNKVQEDTNGESTKARAASATENFNSLSKSTGSDALRDSGEDDGKTRNWKKASQMSALDVMKELEEEKKKRVELEETHKQNEADIKNLQTQLKQAQESFDYEKKRREEQRKELEEVKERLVNSTMELMQLKEEQSGGAPVTSSDPNKPPSRPPSVTNISARRGSTNETSGNDSPAPLRSWNKKVIYDVQEISRQLNNEKKARRELEEWKKEHEEKMEEMKKKVRTETDARIKMEEQHKKLQRELEELRAAFAKATGK